MVVVIIQTSEAQVIPWLVLLSVSSEEALSPGPELTLMPLKDNSQCLYL